MCERSIDCIFSRIFLSPRSLSTSVYYMCILYVCMCVCVYITPWMIDCSVRKHTACSINYCAYCNRQEVPFCTQYSFLLFRAWCEYLCVGLPPHPNSQTSWGSNPGEFFFCWEDSALPSWNTWGGESRKIWFDKSRESRRVAGRGGPCCSNIRVMKMLAVCRCRDG